MNGLVNIVKIRTRYKSMRCRQCNGPAIYNIGVGMKSLMSCDNVHCLMNNICIIATQKEDDDS